MQEAIAAARSLDEVQQLEAMLKAGQIPGQFAGGGANHSGTNHRPDVEVEEDDMER